MKKREDTRKTFYATFSHCQLMSLLYGKGWEVPVLRTLETPLYYRQSYMYHS